jgi:hypothetical protein
MQTKYLAKSTKYQTYRSEHVGPLVRHCVKIARAFLCPGDAKIALDSSWNPLKFPKSEKRPDLLPCKCLSALQGSPHCDMSIMYLHVPCSQIRGQSI